MKVIMKILNVSQGYIAIEDNKPDAINIMKEAAQKEKGIQIIALPTRYPHDRKTTDICCNRRQVPAGGFLQILALSQ